MSYKLPNLAFGLLTKTHDQNRAEGGCSQKRQLTAYSEPAKQMFREFVKLIHSKQMFREFRKLIHAFMRYSNRRWLAAHALLFLLKTHDQRWYVQIPNYLMFREFRKS